MCTEFLQEEEESQEDIDKETGKDIEQHNLKNLSDLVLTFLIYS